MTTITTKQLDATEPDMTLAEARAVVATKTEPRITEDSIKANIYSVEYVRVGSLTICLIIMVNGFVSLGHSKPMSEGNYDAAVGERYAYDNAFKPLWALEAYAALDRKSRAAQTERNSTDG